MNSLARLQIHTVVSKWLGLVFPCQESGFYEYLSLQQSSLGVFAGLK